MARTGDVSKLPQWAQERIAYLERELTNARECLQAERAGHPDSPVQVVDSVHGVKFGLDDRFADVEFQMGDARWPDGRPKWEIDVRRKDGRLEIHGSGTLITTQHSSNVLYVDVADRYELHEEAPVRDLGHRLMAELQKRGLSYQNALDIIFAAPDRPEGESTYEYRKRLGMNPTPGGGRKVGP